MHVYIFTLKPVLAFLQMNLTTTNALLSALFI